MVSFPKGTGPGDLKVKAQKAKKKTEAKTKITKRYMVGVTILAFRQNLLVKVRANNDYCALLEAMRKIRKSIAHLHPENAHWVEENWKEEEKLLCQRFRDYDKLKDYLCCAGFIVSSPLLLEE